MKYNIDWIFDSTNTGGKISECHINVEEHKEIKFISFKIQENQSGRDKSRSLGYGFSVATVYDHTDAPSPNYNHDKTRATQYKVRQFFDKELDMNTMSTVNHVYLMRGTKESVFACAKALFQNFPLDQKDQSKIFDFLETGIFTHQQVFENILTLIFQNNFQAAYTKAVEAEKQGYKGILYHVAEVLLDKGYIQPAYVAFSTVPSSDDNYVKAQITAAKLAATPRVPFDSDAEKRKAVFTHCQNAGEAGQEFIDNFFCNLSGLDGSEEYQVKNIKPDFETLTSFAEVIAKQQREIQELRKKLSKFEDNNNASSHPSPFFTKRSSTEIVAIEVQEASAPQNN